MSLQMGPDQEALAGAEGIKATFQLLLMWLQSLTPSCLSLKSQQEGREAIEESSHMDLESAGVRMQPGHQS